jgi:hypothetical protein
MSTPPDASPQTARHQPFVRLPSDPVLAHTRPVGPGLTHPYETGQGAATPRPGPKAEGGAVRELGQAVRTEWIRCRVCGESVPLDGPFGLLPHVIHEHPDSPMGREVPRVLAREALPLSRA